MKTAWRGVIGFGMVSIPVRLYKATEENGGISFRLLCPCHKKPVKRTDYCGVTGTVFKGDPLHGLKYGSDWVKFNAEDLKALNLESTHTITLRDFTDPDTFDPALYTKDAYYVEPEAMAAKAYLLLAEALVRTNKVALGVVSMYNRERMVSVRSHGELLMLSTMQWPNEVRGPHVTIPDAMVTRQEVMMATTLIHEMSGDFDIRNYRDGYREALLAMAQDKIKGLPVPPARKARPVSDADLVKQLQASIALAAKRKIKKRSA